MSEYAGRIAVGAIVAVTIAVSLGFALYNYVPNGPGAVSSSSTTGATSNVASWVGSSEAPPTNCGDLTNAGSGLNNEGYNETTYATENVPFGGNVCIYTYVVNMSNETASLPTGESIQIKYANTPGVLYYEGECAPPPTLVSFGPNSPGWNCLMTWNTANGFNGTAAHPVVMGLSDPDEFQGEVYLHMSNSATFAVGTVTVYLAQVTTTTSTTASSTTSRYHCGGPTFKLESPLQNGSNPAGNLFMRVVTDQGSVINFDTLPNNGTVFVTHTVPGGDNPVPNYCIRLEDNATGYMPLMVNGPLAGSYNVTIFAGYANGPGYQGTIPSITVQPVERAYFTISVPSGTVTVVECTGSTCTTTTTSATALGGG
jgi:hypothetical protein